MQFQIAASSINYKGVNLNLDNVSVIDSALSPEVIACSETQERFA